MDTEKENQVPERSPSFANRDDGGAKLNHQHADHAPSENQPEEKSLPSSGTPPAESQPEEKPLPSSETSPAENQPEEKPLSSSETSPEEEPIDENAHEDSLKKETQEEAEPIDLNIEEPQPSPLPPDLDKVSEEIDEYISTLSSFKGGESTPPDVPVSVEQFSVLVEARIHEYDSNDSPVRWSQLTDEDAASLLAAVDRMAKLLNTLTEFSSEYKFAYSINRIGGVLEHAMSYMEEEFRALLEDHRLPDADPNNNNNESSKSKPNQEAEQSSDVPESDPVDEEKEFLGYPEETVSNMLRLVKALVNGGHETECCQIYFIARRSVLEENLHKLGFEKHSVDDVQKMSWESLEKEIVAWNETFKQFATMHFCNERKLSAAVFKDYPSIAEILFSNLSRGIIIQLLNFSEAIAMTKRAAEKLFKYLDIYESLRDLLPKMENLFDSECSKELKSEATLTRGRLGEAMISIFCELESSIKADTGKTPVPGGAVHPLTRYTMNYLEYACEYKETLEQVFREHQKIDRADSATGSDFDYNSSAQGGQQSSSYNNREQTKQSPFEMQIMKVMDLLDANMEMKSKLYKDYPLSMIFLMNNGRYILQKIKASGAISSLLGDTWCRKRSSELRQYHKNYQRETWSKLLNCLINHEGLNAHGKVVKPVLKERFKSFNALFDEIHRTQSAWVISDEQLQSELRVSISNMVVPAYRSFLGRFSQYMTPGRQTEKYVKFQPEDVENYIDELFDGNATTPMGRRKP